MLSLLLAIVSLPAEAPVDAPKAPAIGAVVPDFRLPDIHRRPRSLAGYRDARAYVVVFVGCECPLVGLYLNTLKELHRDYAGKGVQILAINANPQDAFLTVSAQAQERELPFPMLKDFEQKAANILGAKRTPEVFLLDAQRTLRYRGRIDDQYGIGFRREKPTRSDLKMALDELLAGKAITTAETEASGCLIGRVKKPRVTGAVTFTRDVSRILQKHCQECHRPREAGPMALLTYAQARDWADTIHEVVCEERMPPWHADSRHGTFSNTRGLSPEERDLLLAWVEQGCPRGDDRDLPAPRVFNEGWKIGTPDAVYRMAEEYKVPATGVLPYRKFTVDPNLKEDAYVIAAECRPGNRAVVHHILVYIQQPGKPIYALDGTAATLAGWAPGDMPLVLPPGSAKKVPAGAKLVFEVHYTPNGTEQVDRSEVGVILSKKPPEKLVETNILANIGLMIPPGAAQHREEFVYTFPRDAEVVSFIPHLHLRGTSARYVATYPDGKQETLLSVPDYDFAWQTVYRFEKPKAMPKGTKLAWIATWDNSEDNPRNPDAKKAIRWGLQTWDEMQNGWMDVIWK